MGGPGQQVKPNPRARPRPWILSIIPWLNLQQGIWLGFYLRAFSLGGRRWVDGGLFLPSYFWLWHGLQHHRWSLRNEAPLPICHVDRDGYLCDGIQLGNMHRALSHSEIPLMLFDWEISRMIWLRIRRRASNTSSYKRDGTNLDRIALIRHDFLPSNMLKFTNLGPSYLSLSNSYRPKVEKAELFYMRPLLKLAHLSFRPDGLPGAWSTKDAEIYYGWACFGLLENFWSSYIQAALESFSDPPFPSL